MAISKQVNTYGLLNQWPEVMRENIWRYNQATGSGVRTSACPVYIQDDREEIARALGQALRRIVEHLRFYPRPIWLEDTIRLGKGYPWQLQRLRTQWGYVEAFGQRATSLISAGASVVYSDADGDGVNDTATITVASSVDPDEAQIFFQVADGAPAAADIRYEIEPVIVTASGGNLIITGPRALFVKPSTIWNVPYDDANKQTLNAADTTDVGDFVTAVDVYRVYNDTTTPVQVIEDPIFKQTTGLGGNVLTTGVARLLDDRLGIFEARVEDPDCLRYAEAVKIYYKAGYPLQFDRPDYTLAEAVIRLANTMMGRQLCSFCDMTDNMWSDDRMPPNSQNPVSQRHVNNPFGTMKGQIYAWLAVMDYALPRGGTLR